jgi:hypothetical protein
MMTKVKSKDLPKALKNYLNDRKFKSREISIDISDVGHLRSNDHAPEYDNFDYSYFDVMNLKSGKVEKDVNSDLTKQFKATKSSQLGKKSLLTDEVLISGDRLDGYASLTMSQNTFDRYFGDLGKVEKMLKGSSLLREIEKMERRFAGTVDYHEYMKQHPRSKKKPNDPMFTQNAPTKPTQQPAQTAPSQPAKQQQPAKQPAQSQPKNDSDLASHVQKRLSEMRFKDPNTYNPHDPKLDQAYASESKDAFAVQYLAANPNAVDSPDLSKLISDGFSTQAKDLDQVLSSQGRGSWYREPKNNKQVHLSTLMYLKNNGLDNSDLARKLESKIKSDPKGYQDQINEHIKLLDTKLKQMKSSAGRATDYAQMAVFSKIDKDYNAEKNLMNKLKKELF